MSYGYSIDLRERVLSYIEGGHTQKEASQVFNVTRQTIYNWLRLKDKTGSLKMCRSGKRKASRFNEDKLREHVLNHEDAYLYEIGSSFGGSASGAYRALKRLKITRKKSLSSTRSGMKRSGKSLSKV
jgi:putative transposase